MSQEGQAPPTPDDVRAASERIRTHVHCTPVLQAETIDAIVGARVSFKCENFQKSGSFKARGAYSALLALLPEARRHGVVTHSSGNHGAAIALAAAENGVPAWIVVPHGAVPKKVANMRRFGAKIVWCAPSLPGRETTAAQVASETGACRIDSYTNPRVIAGQGTSALEFLADIPDIDVLLVPVGGGSLLGGTALALQAIHAKARVIGVEPEMADDAARSFRSGVLTACDRPNTIADGLRVSLSAYTFAIIKEYVEDIVTVSEAGILEAMRLVRSALSIVVEPSSAVPLAALLDGRLQPRFAGKNVGIIFTGGNVASE